MKKETITNNRLRTPFALAGAFGLMLTLAVPAAARQYEREFSASQIRQELKNSLVQIQGALSCNGTEASSIEYCHLRIEDVKTGRSYRLRNAGDLMRLYRQGTRKAAVTGTVIRGDTIEVKNVTPL